MIEILLYCGHGLIKKCCFKETTQNKRISGLVRSKVHIAEVGGQWLEPVFTADLPG